MTVDFNGIGQGQVNSKNSANTGKAATPTPEAPQEQAKAQATRSDSVSLSSQARDLKKLEQRLDSYPEVDDARVEEIKAALADGSYKIDAEQLAQKMLDMDKSIFG